MATVKLTGGKVTLKNGKVSCTCCEAATCCLYPSVGIAGSSYAFADLPSDITFVDSGTPYSWSKTGPQTEEVFFDGVSVGDVVLCYSSGTYYIGYRSDGASWLFVAYDSGEDQYNSLFSIGPCLITGDGNFIPNDDTVEDQFDGTYTGTYGGYDPITLTRISACEWTGSGTGTEDQPYTVRLYYGSDYKWHIAVTISDTTYNWIKDDPQSSPAGDFEGNFTVSI